MLLLPVVSAATTFGILGTLAFTLLAAGVYLSFLLYIDWTRYILEWQGITDLVLRVVFLAMAGNLANTLAEDLRDAIPKVPPRRRATGRGQRPDPARRRRRCAGPTAWPRWDSSRPAWRTSCAIRWAPSKPPPRCWPRTSARKTKWRARWPASSAREVDRTNSLITRFLQFARPLQVRLEKADLTQVLDRAIAMVEREAPGIAIYKNYAPEIPPFRSTPS